MHALKAKYSCFSILGQALGSLPSAVQFLIAYSKQKQKRSDL